MATETEHILQGEVVEFDLPEGEHYRGEVDDEGRPHGIGTMRYPKRPYRSWMEFQVSDRKYHGEWSHGVRSGSGRMKYYRNGLGSAEYQGQWHDDLPEGVGTFTAFGDTTDEKYQGEWLRGLRHGTGTHHTHWDKGTFPNETYTGQRQEDKRCGRGICTYDGEEKHTYEGEWQNNRYHGHGVITLGNGDRIECEWENGNKEGVGTYTFANGKQFRAVWRNNLIDLSSIQREGKNEKPLLAITLHAKGFDYNRTAYGLIEAAEGVFTLADCAILRRDRGFKEKEPLLKISHIGDQEITYLALGEYPGRIRPGERQEHGFKQEDTVRIYDEEYDYTVEHTITIDWCR